MQITIDSIEAIGDDISMYTRHNHHDLNGLQRDRVNSPALARNNQIDIYRHHSFFPYRRRQCAS
jgi:hypothetical protein